MSIALMICGKMGHIWSFQNLSPQWCPKNRSHQKLLLSPLRKTSQKWSPDKYDHVATPMRTIYCFSVLSLFQTLCCRPYVVSVWKLGICKKNPIHRVKNWRIKPCGIFEYDSSIAIQSLSFSPCHHNLWHFDHQTVSCSQQFLLPKQYCVPLIYLWLYVYYESWHCRSPFITSNFITTSRCEVWL